MPSVSGRCGWSCASVNWQSASLSRHRVRHLLRRLAGHLDSRRAISQWIEEQNA